MQPGTREAAPSTDQILVVDGHNDLVWEMRKRQYDFDAVDIAQSQPELHTDLPRIRAGGLGGQFWSVFVPGRMAGEEAVTATLEQIDGVYTMLEHYPDDFVLVTTADGLAASIAEGGSVGSLMGAEGGHQINNSLGTLRMLYRMGVRYLTLTHNENNDWADSATDTPRHGGLTEFGRSVVTEMNRLGMLVDLSHVHADTMRQAIETSAAPVIFSHSSCRAVCSHPRNVPDDVLASLPVNGGTCMITFVPGFVSQACADWRIDAHARAEAAGVDMKDFPAVSSYLKGLDLRPPKATLAHVVAHCEHAREVAGIDHLGLGGDFDGVDVLPVGIDDVSAYPAVLAALADKGWSRADLTKIAHGNIIRTLHDAEDVAVEQRDVETVVRQRA